ncbi:hypothetical protein PRNP1_015324 [Phytophthora ramorum]
MTKLVFFAALLLVIGTALSVDGKASAVPEFAPFDPTEGSGAVNTTLEERLAIDTLPLVDPSEGSKANKFFWLREYYTFLVITFLAIEQFRYSLPILPYPLGRAIFHTAIVSVLTVGLMYGLALFIGFPLPFSILFLTPPWLSFIASFLVIQWLKKIRETPGAVAWLINVIKLWICQVLMVFIYPPY